MTTIEPTDSDIRFSLLDMDFGDPLPPIESHPDVARLYVQLDAVETGLAAIEASNAMLRSMRDARLVAEAQATPAVTETIARVETDIIAPIVNEIPPTPPVSREYTTPERRAEIRRRNGDAPIARVAPPTPQATAEATAQALLDDAIQVSLSSQTGDYPHGCLVGWHPSGDVSYASIQNAARCANVEPPAERSPAALASAAVASLTSAGYRVEVARRGSSWRVYRPLGKVALGESIGSAEVTATLTGSTLVLDGPETLCSSVRACWDAAWSEPTLTSAEITAWLSRLLRTWRAVPTCYGRWLPPAMASRWLVLAGELNVAGLTTVPARPAGVMSRDDVRDEISNGLRGEVSALVGRISNASVRAVAEAKSGGLGVRAASTMLSDIADMRAKIGLYELIAGPMPDARADLDATEAQLSPLVNDTTARAAVLELD